MTSEYALTCNRCKETFEGNAKEIVDKMMGHDLTKHRVDTIAQIKLGQMRYRAKEWLQRPTD